MFFDELYTTLKDGFQNSRFSRLFQNTELGKLLAKDEKPSAWDFFNTYLSSWWWERLYFRLCILTTPNPQQITITEQRVTLIPSGLLVNFDSVLESLQCLKNAEIFTQDNLNKVIDMSDSVRVFDSGPVFAFGRVIFSLLDHLSNVKQLNQDNFTKFAFHTNQQELNLALNLLYADDILTPDNIAAVADHTNPKGFAQALCYLNKAGILTPENRAQLINYKHEALILDNFLGGLFWRKFQHPVGQVIGALFGESSYNHRLTQKNFDILLKVAENNPNELEKVRKYLKFDNPVSKHYLPDPKQQGNALAQDKNDAVSNSEQSTQTVLVHQLASPEYNAFLDKQVGLVKHGIWRSTDQEDDKQVGIELKCLS
jgi:hypothetical protein